MKIFKRILILCLVTFILTSCAKETKDNNPSHSFYYCQRNYQYGSEYGAISPQAITLSEDMSSEEIIAKYLSGPEADTLSYPFPEGTKLESLQTTNDHTEIILSTEFAQLKKIDLTIACACLTLTISELTNCKTVEIAASNALLNGQNSIIMDTNAISLIDSITAQQN